MENMMEAHFLSMVLIGVGSFIFGILPLFFSLRMTRSHPFCLSLVLCIGAGVLLATSLVHMLTEVQLKLKWSTQLYFCAGFLTLYIFDEITHYCLGARKFNVNSTISEPERNRNIKTNNYGATRDFPSYSQSSSLLESSENKNIFRAEGVCECSHSRLSDRRNVDERRSSQQNLLDVCLPSENNEYNVTCHSEEEQLFNNSTARTGLLLALLIHSILEGMSIGVQTETSQIMVILGAVSFHKIVLSFCLGLELHQQGFKPFHLMSSIFLFSIGSPIGIFIGMTVTSGDNGFFNIAAKLQAVAAGSLLYVAAFEVLPRERLKWQRSAQKGAGIFQLIFLLMGFICITVFHFFLDSSHEGGKTNNITNLPERDVWDISKLWIP